SLFSVAKKVTKNACPCIRPRLRRGSFAPSPLRGSSYKGHPWPFTTLAASLRLAPLRNDSAHPPERAGWWRLLVRAKRSKAQATPTIFQATRSQFPGRREPRRSRGRMSGALSLWLLSLSREQRESDSAGGPKPGVSAHSVIGLAPKLQIELLYQSCQSGIHTYLPVWLKPCFVQSYRNDLRNRDNAPTKNTPPNTTSATSCGQTISAPAPRKRIAWASSTKCVVGAASIRFWTISGMLSRGVMPPERICSGISVRMTSKPSCGIERASVPKKMPIEVVA